MQEALPRCENVHSNNRNQAEENNLLHLLGPYMHKSIQIPTLPLGSLHDSHSYPTNLEVNHGTYDLFLPQLRLVFVCLASVSPVARAPTVEGNEMGFSTTSGDMVMPRISEGPRVRAVRSGTAARCRTPHLQGLWNRRKA